MIPPHCKHHVAKKFAADIAPSYGTSQVYSEVAKEEPTWQEGETSVR